MKHMLRPNEVSLSDREPWGGAKGKAPKNAPNGKPFSGGRGKAPKGAPNGKSINGPKGKNPRETFSK